MNVRAIYFRQTERAFARDVIRYAEQYGWRVLHDGTARLPAPCRSCGEPQAAGRRSVHLPHLILTRRPRVLFVELRSERNDGCAERIAFLAELAQCGQEVVTWKPSTWRQIEVVLR